MKKQDGKGRSARSEPVPGGREQTVRGQLSLEAGSASSEARVVKVAASRDGSVLASRRLEVEAGCEEVSFELSFTTEHERPIGVRVLAGPDVPDERLAAADSRQAWVRASEFDSGAAEVRIAVPEAVLLRWLGWCRTYTLRGRVVCRTLGFEPGVGFTFCDAPVRGAKVTAHDVDFFWWWFRQDAVGSAYTDVDGYFEITFRWCCWPWHPWYFDRWTVDPSILKKIRDVVATSERPIPLPDPDPTPDLSLLQTLGDGAARFMPQAVAAAPVPGSRSVGTLGDRLMTLLPPSPELERLHIWPWYPIHDCRPDIVFTVEQDCGEGPVEIYRENALATRWNIPTTVDDIVLVANEDACCAPACEPDPPDGDCLAIHGPGCGGYSIDYVEQDPTDPLAGYYTFGSADVLFGGKIPIRGVFGDAAGVQYYKPQRRRLQPPAIPGAWEDVPADEVAVFVRRHWIGPPPPFWKSESVGLVTVNDPTAPGGQRQVLKTVGRYQAEDGDVVPGVPGRNHDMLFSWRTATQSSTGGGHQSGLPDGLYELRFLGYGYDQENDRLVDERVMPLCPAVGKEVDPNVHSTLLLSLDNRIWSTVAGSVHLDTQEPECDLVSVTVERSGGGTEAVAACGFARVKADDTIRIRFRASDADSHLGGFALTAHWGDGLVFDVLDAGSLTAVGGSLLGRSYAEVIGDPGHVRPFWAGGTYEVAVVVGAPVPGSPHQAFGTCCAFQLDLRTWKRTTDGCTDIRHFHRNHCEYSFTVIRTDLIDHPDHPSCTSLCEEDD